jgi:hypothetical protein
MPNDNDLLARATRWRFHADQLRAIAAGLEDDLQEANLLKLADQWDAMAARFETQAREKWTSSN